jgi:hypothetical protein
MEERNILLENIMLKDQVATLKEQINKFAPFLKPYEDDTIGLSGNTDLEMNLIDQFEEILKEFHKMQNKINGGKK